MRAIYFCFLLIIYACQSPNDKAAIINSAAQDSLQPDSMPVLIPEAPESANIVVPEHGQNMPVIAPDSINPEE